MKCRCLPLSELPSSTPLYSAFLEDFSRLSEFFHHPPSEEGVKASAGEVALSAEIRGEVVGILREQNQRFGSGQETEASLTRMERGAVAIVTGQQTGLFSGPSYTVYKALLALRAAEEMTAAGTPAVPVFWMATEDHDLTEVNHCYWLGNKRIERLELQRTQEEGRPVGDIRLGVGINEVVANAAEQLQGPGAEWVGTLLRECYGPGETFGSALGKLLARLFANRGLILVDPLDARLHRLAAPVFRRALDEHVEITKDLLKRGTELESAGFHAQVRVSENGTTLFMVRNRRRWPIKVHKDRFIANKEEFTAPELLDLLEREPALFSPNALLRPIMQDMLLPTAAYVGGPAEIAYFAQSGVLYQRLLGRMPAVLPRASFTIVDAKVSNLLEKYGIDVPDVWKGRQQLRKRMEQGFLPESLQQDFENGEKSVAAVLDRLRRPVEELDQTLVGTLETTRAKILLQFENLKAKAGRALDFRTGVIDGHEKLLTDSLFAQHDLQERSLCFLPFLARHGREFLGALEKQATLRCTNHQLVYLQ
ncbi:MAG TPA: bacillithiol biosynthesis cysteine-adding enzyme BshC [Candidatus Dormibacteraeota bacterium]|nr:bacillithiol biosynthesis cysteine-adding enzyme BshC [Candidatus Dormibacteraeota bacterium]